MYYIVDFLFSRGASAACPHTLLDRRTAPVDWITLLIEAVGVVILLLWVVIPIQEFKTILSAVHRRNAERAHAQGEADPQSEPRGGPRA